MSLVEAASRRNVAGRAVLGRRSLSHQRRATKTQLSLKPQPGSDVWLSRCSDTAASNVTAVSPSFDSATSWGRTAAGFSRRPAMELSGICQGSVRPPAPTEVGWEVLLLEPDDARTNWNVGFQTSPWQGLGRHHSRACSPICTSRIPSALSMQPLRLAVPFRSRLLASLLGAPTRGPRSRDSVPSLVDPCLPTDSSFADA